MDRFKMTKQYKEADKYVTFLPTGKEYSLIGFQEGYGITETDKKYLDYGFTIAKNFRNQEYYKFLIDTKKKLELVSNAYSLHYEAIYQDERFGASVSKYPLITLFAGTNDYSAKARTNIEGFTNEVGRWVKHVDVSEVEIIPVKEPIDLVQFLPNNTIK
ncbi:hypothetical protein OfM1_14830 [Lactovum odontotermitis]